MQNYFNPPTQKRVMNVNAEPIHVISILWGSVYSEVDVNRLFAMIRLNTSLPIRFHLFSNEAHPDLDPEIQQHPEPGLSVEPKFNRNNYRKEVGLCADDLGGLTGKRVFFFDLDVLITGNMDALFLYPKNDELYIINDWNTRDNTVGQASCYSFVVGTLGFIKDAFEADPETALKTYGTASQEYLSSKIIDRFGTLNFWPEEWFKSFRYHCLPWGPLRHFITPRKPKPSTKVLAFHGHPDIEDAIIGRWSPPGNYKAASGWKKLYKACKPTPWVEELWCIPTTAPNLEKNAEGAVS
jgi:hypothetical protein